MSFANFFPATVIMNNSVFKGDFFFSLFLSFLLPFFLSLTAKSTVGHLCRNPKLWLTPVKRSIRTQCPYRNRSTSTNSCREWGWGVGWGVSSYSGSINRAGSCEVARALSVVVDFKLRPQEPEGGGEWLSTTV